MDETETAMEPEWIVNTLGELGVKIGDRLFFLYKGDNIEYDPNERDPDDPEPILWRLVGKREFGETCHPHKLKEFGEQAWSEYCRNRENQEYEHKDGSQRWIDWCNDQIENSNPEGDPLGWADPWKPLPQKVGK